MKSIHLESSINSRAYIIKGGYKSIVYNFVHHSSCTEAVLTARKNVKCYFQVPN